MVTLALSDNEFELFRDLIYGQAGISLSPAKKPLVVGRLGKRLRHHNLTSFKDYFELVSGGHHQQEMQTLVDLLTTNETYFFREHKHFDFLHDEFLPQLKPTRPLRVWSAAASTGEEAYTLAMVLADALPKHPSWEVLGTDINSKVLETARRAIYPIEAASKIPQSYLQAHCLKGVGDYAGSFTIDKALRERVRFQQMNLLEPCTGLGTFDVIFLRNVMIYFDTPTKRRLVAHVHQLLRPGGVFCVGHSEGLVNISNAFKAIRPSIYCKRE